LLPQENQFNASRMSYLLFSFDQIRPLQHVRLAFWMCTYML